MKNPIMLLSLKSLLRNRKYTFAALSVFFLAVVTAVSEMIVLSSLENTQKTELLRNNGKQNGILLQINEASIVDLENYGFDEIGYIKNFAVCHDNDEAITVGVMDDTAVHLSCITLVEGRMPSNKNEIAIEISACDKLGIPKKLGQVADIRCSALDGAQENNYRFTVVGIIANYSEIQVNQYDATPGFDTLPGVFVSSTEHCFFKNEPVLHAMTFLKEAARTRAIYEECMEKGIAEKCFYNTAVYPTLFRDNDRQDILAFLRGIFLLVVNVFSIICLLTVFVILNRNMAARNRRILLAGATNGQLLRIVLLKNTFLFLTAVAFAVPIALFIGYLPSFFTVYHYSVPYSFIAIAVAVIFCVMLAVNIILTVFSFRKVSEKSKSVRIKVRSKNPVLMWAAKHYKTNTGAFVFPCVSFALSIAVLSVSLFIYSVNVAELQESNLSFDYKLSCYNGVFASELRIPTELSVGFSERDYDILRSNTELEKAWAVKSVPFNILINKENRERCEKYTGGISLKAQSDVEAYTTELMRYQYDKNDELYANRIRGLERRALSQLKEFEIAGDVADDALYSAKGVIACVTKKDVTMQIGDEITFTQLVRLGEDAFDFSKVQKIQFTVRVKAICVLNPDTPEAEIFAPDTVSFLWGNSSFERLGIPAAYHTIYAQLADADCYRQIDKDIESLKNNYPNMSSESRHQLADYYRDLQEILLLICVSIIVIVLLSGTLSNAVIMNSMIKEQWRQFGVAVAAGMLKSQVKTFILWEAFLTAIVSWMFGAVLSVVFCLLLSLNSYVDYLAFIPWSGILLSLPTLSVICILSVAPSLYILSKESVIDMLKTAG